MLTCSIVVLCFELPNTMTLVFEIFNISLLTANHTDNVSSSLLIYLLSCIASCPEQKILVSSAKRTNFSILLILHISFTYKMNSFGPNMEPWGTPHKTINKSELNSSIEFVFYKFTEEITVVFYKCTEEITVGVRVVMQINYHMRTVWND